MSNPFEKTTTVNKIQNSAEHLNNDIHKAAADAGLKVRGFINSANEEICQAGEKVKSQIRTHPVQSAAIALGVGVVLGALMRR